MGEFVGVYDNELDGEFKCEYPFFDDSEFESIQLPNFRLLYRTNQDTVDKCFESNDYKVVVFGNIYGHLKDTQFDYQFLSDSPAKYVHDLYNVYGEDCIRDLNGEFILIVYGINQDTLEIFTDRLGTRPVFYTESTQGVLFSTNPQVFPFFDTEIKYNREYLTEFLSCRRVLGNRSPLEGVYKVPPGSLLSNTPDEVSTRSYWDPKYNPEDKPFKYFQNRFNRVIESLFDERFPSDDNIEIGYLLSGGSDSRLIGSALPDDGIAFHMNEWFNTEAKVAKDVANILDHEFVFLERDRNHFYDLLTEHNSIFRYNGFFQGCSSLGFSPDITSRCDVLISGMYSDIFLKGYHLPKYSVRFPIVGNIPLPIYESLRDEDDLVQYITSKSFLDSETAVPEYVTDDIALGDIVKDNLDISESITCHGVEYDSAELLSFFNYPLTNDYGEPYFVMDNYITKTNPFLDYRIIDLQLEMPLEYHLTKDLVNGYLKTKRGVSEIRHATSGIPVKYPSLLHWLSWFPNVFLKELIKYPRPPESHMTNIQWTNHTELIRNSEEFETLLHDAIKKADRLNFIDSERMTSIYEDHMNGEDRTHELYSFIQLFSMPATDEIIRNHGELI
ncbi:hypothetical protein [Haloferax sp. YSSS75]|uniref:hypothetical protein n=1 Tax=Haloferax sp. YSSS75 TaxID=3388564 RepID=UPI00398CF50C